MKNILMIFVVICLTSCWEDHSTDPVIRTRAGKLIYDYTAQFFEQPIEIINVALNMQEYINAPTPQEKEKVEDRLLSRYKIRVSGNTYRLNIMNATSWAFETAGEKLSDPGSQWHVTRVEQSYFEEGGHCIIRCISPNKWEMQLKDIYNKEFIKTASLTIEITDRRDQEEFPSSDYTILGEGTLLSNEGMLIDGKRNKFLEIKYKIASPMTYAAKPPTGTNPSNSDAMGKIDLTVTNATHPEPEPINATLSGNIYNPNVTLTFMGNTETWNDYRVIRWGE